MADPNKPNLEGNDEFAGAGAGVGGGNYGTGTAMRQEIAFSSPVLAWFDARLRDRNNLRLPGNADGVMITGLTPDGKYFVCATAAGDTKNVPVEKAHLDAIAPELIG